MNQLDLVWKLEKYDDLVKEHKKKYEEILLSKKKEEFLKDLNRLDISLDKKRNLKREIKSNIRNTENQLKILNYDLEKIEEELYNGEISDIKQLEYLNKKKVKVRNLIDSIESELITYLDSADNNVSEIDQLDKKMKVKKDKLNEYLKKLDLEVEKLREEIKLKEDYILKLREEIDRNLLSSYDQIKKNKNKAIVSAEKGICKGCNMVLSSALWDKVKNSYGISQCENCGRILIYKE